MFKINPTIPNYSIGYKNFSMQQSSTVPNEENPEKLNNDLNKLSEIAKSQINFRAGRFKLHEYDAMFVGALGAAFSLTAASLDKVKDTIAEFLKSNNCSSMSDLGGEDNLDKQCELTDKINDVINLDDRDYEALANKVMHRCDSNVVYDPNDDYIEKMSFVLENSIKKKLALIKQNDERLINSIILTFDLNSEQQQILRDTINNALEKSKMPSIKVLGNCAKYEKIGELIDEITEKLDLSLGQTALITAEFSRRISMYEEDYKPKINPLDRNAQKSISDSAILNKILSNYNIAAKDVDDLLIAMKQDACENGFTSIFDLFADGQNINHFKAVNDVLNSERFTDNRFDILIDLHVAAKDSSSISKQIKQDETEYEGMFLRNCAVMCILDDKVDFSKEELQKLKSYLKASKLDVRKENDLWKAAYEISEMFNISSADIEKAIREANKIPKEELDFYNFSFCDKLVHKK